MLQYVICLCLFDSTALEVGRYNTHLYLVCFSRREEPFTGEMWGSELKDDGVMIDEAVGCYGCYGSVAQWSDPPSAA